MNEHIQKYTFYSFKWIYLICMTTNDQMSILSLLFYCYVKKIQHVDLRWLICDSFVIWCHSYAFWIWFLMSIYLSIYLESKSSNTLSSWTAHWESRGILTVFRFPTLIQRTRTSSTAHTSSFSTEVWRNKAKVLPGLTEVCFLHSGNKEIACFLLENGAGFSSYTLMDHADFSGQLLRQRLLQDKDTPADGRLLQVRLIHTLDWPKYFKISAGLMNNAAAFFYRSFTVSTTSSL